MKSVLVAMTLFLGFLLSYNAQAARAYGQSVIYFDANGSVVGQQLAYCNNVQYHGGNISSPYHMEIWTGCGGASFTCIAVGRDTLPPIPAPGEAPTSPPAQWSCDYNGIDTSLEALEYNLPPGMTGEDACAITQGSCELYPSPLLGSFGFPLFHGWK